MPPAFALHGGAFSTATIGTHGATTSNTRLPAGSTSTDGLPPGMAISARLVPRAATTSNWVPLWQRRGTTTLPGSRPCVEGCRPVRVSVCRQAAVRSHRAGDIIIEGLHHQSIDLSIDLKIKESSAVYGSFGPK